MSKTIIKCKINCVQLVITTHEQYKCNSQVTCMKPVSSCDLAENCTIGICGVYTNDTDYNSYAPALELV